MKLVLSKFVQNQTKLFGTFNTKIFDSIGKTVEAIDYIADNNMFVLLQTSGEARPRPVEPTPSKEEELQPPAHHSQLRKMSSKGRQAINYLKRISKIGVDNASDADLPIVIQPDSPSVSTRESEVLRPDQTNLRKNTSIDELDDLDTSKIMRTALAKPTKRTAPTAQLTNETAVQILHKGLNEASEPSPNASKRVSFHLKDEKPIIIDSPPSEPKHQVTFTETADDESEEDVKVNNRRSGFVQPRKPSLKDQKIKKKNRVSFGYEAVEEDGGQILKMLDVTSPPPASPLPQRQRESNDADESEESEEERAIPPPTPPMNKRTSFQKEPVVVKRADSLEIIQKRLSFEVPKVEDDESSESDTEDAPAIKVNGNTKFETGTKVKFAEADQSSASTSDDVLSISLAGKHCDSFSLIAKHNNDHQNNSFETSTSDVPLAITRPIETSKVEPAKPIKTEASATPKPAVSINPAVRPANPRDSQTLDDFMHEMDSLISKLSEYDDSPPRSIYVTPKSSPTHSNVQPVKAPPSSPIKTYMPQSPVSPMTKQELPISNNKHTSVHISNLRDKYLEAATTSTSPTSRNAPALSRTAERGTIKQNERHIPIELPATESLSSIEVLSVQTNIPLTRQETAVPTPTSGKTPTQDIVNIPTLQDRKFSSKSVLMESWVEMCEDSKPAWQKRWCTLEGGYIWIFNDPSESIRGDNLTNKPRGMIALSKCAVEGGKKVSWSHGIGNYLHYFTITMPEKQVTFACESKEDVW